MPETFKPGDRVRLKDGDVVMAVTGVGPDSYGKLTVWCAWFEDNHLQQTAGFASSSLQAVEIADLGPAP